MNKDRLVRLLGYELDKLFINPESQLAYDLKDKIYDKASEFLTKISEESADIYDIKTKASGTQDGISIDISMKMIKPIEKVTVTIPKFDGMSDNDFNRLLNNIKKEIETINS